MSDSFQPDSFQPDSFQPDESAAKPKLGKANKVLNWIGRGAWALPGALGLDYETATAGAEKAWASLKGNPDAVDFDKRRESLRGLARQADAENPISSGLVRGFAQAPGDALAWAAAGPVKLAQGASFLHRALAYGPKMGALAGAGEFGSTGHREMGDRLAGAAGAAAAGTVLGGTAAGVLPNPAALVSSTTHLEKPRFGVSKDAALLEANGVEGLTVGQRISQDTWKGKFLAKLEADSAGHMGGMAEERQAANLSRMRATHDFGVAPGEPKPTSLDLQNRAAEVRAGLKRGYAKVGQKEVPGPVVDDLPRTVVRDVDSGVDDITRAEAAKHVENSLSTLPQRQKPQPGPAGLAPPQTGGSYGTRYDPAPSSFMGRDEPPPTTRYTVQDLIKAREWVRDRIREAGSGREVNHTLIRQYEHAEDAYSKAIQAALSPQEQQYFNALETQYARHMTALDAPGAGLTEFTPRQHLAQIERRGGRVGFLTDKLGPDQNFSEAAQRVFMESPKTGYLTAALSSVPGAKKYGGLFMRGLNTPQGRAALFDPRFVSSSPIRRSFSPEAQALIEALRGGQESP